MEQGGAIIWSELDIERSQWNRDSELWYKEDVRELVMRGEIKLATTKTVWFPLAEVLDIHRTYARL